jgi:hypothetical protein
MTNRKREASFKFLCCFALEEIPIFLFLGVLSLGMVHQMYTRFIAPPALEEPKRL